MPLIRPFCFSDDARIGRRGYNVAMRHWSGSVGRWAVWAAVLFALYEALEDSPQPDELVAGAAIAAVAAAVVLRGYAVAQTRYAADWWRLRAWIALPWMVLRDACVVGAAIARSLWDPAALKGRVEQRPFDFGEPHDPHAATRRAVETFRISAAPNTVVAMIEPDVIAVHHLV